MKRFTYSKRRRYCPRCDGDGREPHLRWMDCFLCGGEGFTGEEAPPGEKHLLVVRDQRGVIVEMTPVAGSDPPKKAIRIPDVVIFLALAALFLVIILAMILTH